MFFFLGGGRGGGGGHIELLLDVMQHMTNISHDHVCYYMPNQRTYVIPICILYHRIKM